jgi:hypothetical protein
VSQHASLSPDRWSQFPLPQQLLMIANEMNRASKLLHATEFERLRNGYARTLALADLTIQTTDRRAVRRELLRWRDLVAALYVAPVPDPIGHGAAFRVLLQLHPETWRQLPHVAGAAPF